MSMIKRGHGSTGHIVQAVDGDQNGMCIDCGRLFPMGGLSESERKCESCTMETPEASGTALSSDGSCKKSDD